MVQRITEGQFDIGATFPEPFEEALYNELMMYFVRRVTFPA